MYRTIHFYRLVPYRKTAAPVKRAQLAAAITKLNPGDDSSHMETQYGEKLCLWNDTDSNTVLKLSLGKIRERNLPGTVRKGGHRDGLKVPNVFEPIHIVVFPLSVVGVEWNQYGPRALSAFPGYLSQKCPDIEPSYLKPLYDQDVIDTLNRFSEITLMTLELEREKVGLLNNADPKLSSGLKKISDKYPSASVALTLKLQPDEKRDKSSKKAREQRDARKKSIDQFSHAIFEEIQLLATDATALESLSSFQVHGFDSRTKSTRTVNLLDARITARKKVDLIDPNHGLVESESMYNAIIAAHKELEETIKIAVAAGQKGY
jgi:hypothetical protein